MTTPWGCLVLRISRGAWWDCREDHSWEEQRSIPLEDPRLSEVILMSPEGTDPGIPQEEELRPLVLEDQRPQ